MPGNVRPVGPQADSYQPTSDFSWARRSGGRPALQLPPGVKPLRKLEYPPPPRPRPAEVGSHENLQSVPTGL